MIRSYRVIRQSAQIVAEAALEAVGALKNGRVSQEPQFTDRMLGSIEHSLRGLEVRGVHWSAMTLADRGRGSQEHDYGADFMGVLSIKLPDFHVNKGFLAQAKLVSTDRKFSRADRGRLRDQCKRMLRLSPDAFVFLYSQWGISVVPAISVLGTEASPTELYFRTVKRFFEDHFESFIGDPRIAMPYVKTLEELRLQFEARTALFIQVRPEPIEGE